MKTAYLTAARAAERAARTYRKSPTPANHAAAWAASTAALDALIAWRAAR
tara:strand:- start:4059 stop:4208 length:150 start_codon:yes stop_codon:yes gene_type:complete